MPCSLRSDRSELPHFLRSDSALPGFETWHKRFPLPGMPVLAMCGFTQTIPAGNHEDRGWSWALHCPQQHHRAALEYMVGSAEHTMLRRELGKAGAGTVREGRPTQAHVLLLCPSTLSTHVSGSGPRLLLWKPTAATSPAHLPSDSSGPPQGSQHERRSTGHAAPLLVSAPQVPAQPRALSRAHRHGWEKGKGPPSLGRCVRACMA